MPQQPTKIKEIKDHSMSILLSVLVWNYICSPSANWMLSSQSVLGGLLARGSGECCSHNRAWLSAIFPSLHHGPRNPKPNVTTTQACGSPLFSTPSHPNRSVKALCGVMSWGDFHNQKAPREHVKFQFTCSDRAEQLTIISEHCPLQPAPTLRRSHQVCCVRKDRND